MRAVTGTALLAVAVLLAGCGSDDPAAACEVDVTSSDLVADREAAGVPDCAPGGGDADLPDVALPCLGSDEEATLSSVEGPAVINFWASWCEPCIKEMPALAEFHERYGDQVAVVGVNWQDGYPAAAIDLARTSGTAYPSLADPCGALSETDLAIVGLPQFVFVKEDGSVELANGGKESLDEVVDMVEAKLDIDLERARS
ncbi:thiol-disulfide isomerase/thioredoxin [Nocardioides thalensis]|uniref:Thiol-disulfide isomerase/thioredoxin n=1 Tax=Nocardioides thalensis TaxID=1914755 RepID=A0A853BUB3_9ACTN|nr:TlpA disulfide reductase family protein [Nocardioides thalensis]NYI99439.1 thiol-disulfide isomerase/thioredoxin [Nocardioides thalensis]